MNQAKPMIGKLSIEEKTNQVSGPSKSAIEDRRISLKMVQNILLIWLDNNIDDNSTNCRNTITQLRCAVNTIKIFTDAEECIEFLESLDNEKACMIISGSLGQHMVSRVHDMSQVDSIFIFCDNKQHHEQWAKEWYKIKGVFTEMTSIYETLKQVARQYEQNAIPISFMATSGDISKKNLDQLEPSFMYTQILKEILLTIEFPEKHFEEFISYCHDALLENEGELKKVDEFRRNYRSETPIWWYSYSCFLYSMLNRALRLMDVDVIIKMGFFMGDLHRHIEQLYKEQFDSQNFGTSFTVYRGQGMSKSEFEQMTKTKGGLISFNSFLSTSKNHDVSLLFAESNQSNPNLVGILFVLKIDSSQSSAPFASINSVSYFQTEEEVLFSMHTIFRICEIKSIGESDRLFQVELTLTSDKDKDLHQLTDRIREETEKSAGWAQLGELLLKLGQNEKAQQIYQRLLNHATNESEKAPIYQQLAQAKYNLGEYKEAIIINEKALEIRQQLLSPNHPDVAKSYNNIGTVYYRIAEYSRSLSSHEKALEIQQHSLPPHHPHLAETYNNLGLVYYSIGEYSKALLSHEKALEIKQQSLPPNHPDLATSYNNIGNVYYRMGEYSKAFSYHEIALEIKQQSLLPNHPDLASSYNNIGLLYEKMGEYSKARSSHEKAFEIQQQSLLPNHPDLASSHNNIGLLYEKMGEYSKALSSHEKALEIGQQSFSPIHSDLAGSYKNIGFVYYSMREYSKSLSSHEKALEIQQQSLSRNHPDLAGSYNIIGLMYDIMGEYSKSLLSHEKALEIKQQSLPPNHPDLAETYNNIGLVYDSMREYSKALSSYEKAVEIKQQSLPPIHPHLAETYNNIGAVYHRMGEYSKALLSHEKVLEIKQQSLPPNHPDLAASYNNIGVVYDFMGEYSKARSFYELAVNIGQLSLATNSTDL